MKHALLFLFYISTISPALHTQNIAISLGGCCTNALMLREYNVRQAAYPFDWIISPFDSLYQAIADDFKYFLDVAYLHVASNNCMVIDYYGLYYVHDFPTIDSPAAIKEHKAVSMRPITPLRNDWEKYLPQIQEKYQRRIERFRTALRSKDHVFLFRSDISKEQAIRLRDLLETMYPAAQFTLIVLDMSRKKAAQRDLWHERAIKQYSCAVKENKLNIMYQRIFKQLRLIPNSP
ncbi:MAG: DUF1796 family putative cysteine peptidase [Candidatus Babeliales bacterium]